MGLLDSVNNSNLFTASSSQDAGRENIAQKSLISGLDAYQKKDYDTALAKFRQAANVAPRSTAAANAYVYIARVYQTKGDTESAIDAYKQSLKVDNTNLDTHLALGNLYITANRPEDARDEYLKAVKIDPSAFTRYYLAQSYLQTGEYDKAEQQFQQIQRLDTKGPYGDFGLGQTYAKQGRYSEAIQSFEAAISRKRDYWDAYAEMGYAYADMGDFDQANKIATQLSNQYKQDALSLTLSVYIAKKTPPKMDARLSTGTFLASLGPGTGLSVLGTSLAAPNSQQLASVVFAFSGAMDAKSVENVANWDISRAIGTNLANTYNYGWAPPSTEALLPNTPVAVQYDKVNKTATVYFNIYQNAAGNGTIDPSHIQFSFKGVSVDGVAMDPTADNYTGFSGFF